jgi:hypothetical protein
MLAILTVPTFAKSSAGARKMVVRIGEEQLGGRCMKWRSYSHEYERLCPYGTVWLRDLHEADSYKKCCGDRECNVPEGLVSLLGLWIFL